MRKTNASTESNLETSDLIYFYAITKFIKKIYWELPWAVSIHCTTEVIVIGFFCLFVYSAEIFNLDIVLQKSEKCPYKLWDQSLFSHAI